VSSSSISGGGSSASSSTGGTGSTYTSVSTSGRRRLTALSAAIPNIPLPGARTGAFASSSGEDAVRPPPRAAPHTAGQRAPHLPTCLLYWPTACPS
jgi:hypothetical protein